MAFTIRELSPTTATAEMATELPGDSDNEIDDEASSSSEPGTGAQRHKRKQLPASDDEHSESSDSGTGAQRLKQRQLPAGDDRLQHLPIGHCVQDHWRHTF